MKRGEIVIVSLPSGDTYARFVGFARGGGYVVDYCGVRVVVASVVTAPKGVQP